MRWISGPSRTLGGSWIAIVALLVAPMGFAEADDKPKPKDSASKKLEKPKPAKALEEEKKAEADARTKDEARKVAEKYLVLLDKGKYAEGWDAMTEEVRKGITRRKWVDALSKTRGPFGKLRGRQLNRVEMRATEVADQLDEAWVYTDFRTVDGVASSELVIVVLEKGKAWAVGSYYVGDPRSFPKPVDLDEGEKAKPPSK